MHACTIVARNYLAQAQVLVDSFRKHHPDGTIDVLLIDDPATERPQVDGADVLMIDEIGIDAGRPRADDGRLRADRDRHGREAVAATRLLDRGFDHAVYFDPDISIERPIAELPGPCREHSIVLTPHLTEPMPRDGGLPFGADTCCSPAPTTSASSGWATPSRHAGCSTGGAPASPRTPTSTSSTASSPTSASSTSSRPVRAHLVKDPSWNVAYWNLATRPLTRGADGGLLVAGHPLTFVHLSGYSPRQPHLLSKHQGRKPRLLLSEDAVLRDICDDYGARLPAAGFETRQTGFVAPFTLRRGRHRPDRAAPRAQRDPRRACGKGTGLGWSDTAGQ